jgi:uncharacterized protein involved in type VI secretion and phage assembly
MNPLFDSLNNMNDKMMGLMNGVYIGVVTNINDPEKISRIKVKIPILDPDKESDWARVATLTAGAKRGTLFMPEVGDEVVIAFQMGDIREPIIIGSLWSKKNAPPAGMDEKNNIRKITSRDGHEIILDDTSGDGKITVKTKEGHILDLQEKTDTIKLQEKSGQNAITIKGGGSGQIEVKSGSTKITINSKGDTVIESMKSVKIKSTQIAIEATGSLDLKSNGLLNINANGVLTLKGAMVKIN